MIKDYMHNRDNMYSSNISHKMIRKVYDSNISPNGNAYFSPNLVMWIVACTY